MLPFEKLREPLPIESIDFRIQSINNGKYATILAYKDARVDMNVLDNVLGCQNWKREHYDNNTRCKVSVYNEEIMEWVGKEDVGTQSMTEKEKGLASDSFKRACFNWGIGRELYDYPVISIRLKDDEIQETGNARPKYKASFNLKLKDWVWTSIFLEGQITALKCVDDKGNERFKWLIGNKPPVEPVPKKEKVTKVSKEYSLGAGISDLNQCRTLEDIKKVWTAHNHLQTEDTFIKLKDLLKTKLSK